MRCPYRASSCVWGEIRRARAPGVPLPLDTVDAPPVWQAWHPAVGADRAMAASTTMAEASLWAWE